MTPDEVRAAMEDYLGRVRALAWELQDYFPPGEDFAQVHRFIDHGEMGEGLRALIWAIHIGQVDVPLRLTREIYEAMAPFIRIDDLPDGFVDWGLGGVIPEPDWIEVDPGILRDDHEPGL